MFDLKGDFFLYAYVLLQLLKVFRDKGDDAPRVLAMLVGLAFVAYRLSLITSRSSSHPGDDAD